MLPNLPALTHEYKPPAIVQSLYDQIDHIQAEIKAEEARIAAEAIRKAAEEAERARMAAVIAAHPLGNNYTPGNCTWYVANKRPVPLNLGNANTWFARATAWGFPTGYEPKAGAVGQKGMHVVYVESVNADGSMNISEMNGRYILYEISSRTINPSGWQFIY